MSSTSPKVLIVEDDDDLGRFVVDIATDHGYQATHVADALSGIRLLPSEKFELLITDIRMPGMDGIELISRAKAHDPFLAGTWTGGPYFYAALPGKHGGTTTTVMGDANNHAGAPFALSQPYQINSTTQLGAAGFVRADVDGFTGKWVAFSGTNTTANDGYTGKIGNAGIDYNTVQELIPTDIPGYQRLLIHLVSAFNAQAVRPYFNFPDVQRGVFELTQRLLGLRYQQVEGLDLWHQSVTAWDVYDGARLVGRFYLDLHPRENKYGHAAQFDYRTGIAGKRLPQASLVCNFPDPADSATCPNPTSAPGLYKVTEGGVEYDVIIRRKPGP